VNEWMNLPLQIQVLVWIALAQILVAAILAWVFVARHSRTRFWETREGRYLMRSKIGVALLFTQSLVFQVVEPKILTRLVITILILGFICYSLGELLFLQTRAKHERKLAARRAQRSG
jgi:phosphatidylserine synthase